MSGKEEITSASEYLSEQLADKCRNKDISNTSWKKLKHWANWWTSTRHLQMFTKAYAIQEGNVWDNLSNTTNPVESINRQSFKSKNNLNVILENIYMEDCLHAVKMLARSQNVNIDNSTSSKKNRKRKRSSLIRDKSDDNGPPDKIRHVRDAKEGRKKGRALIDCVVKVEYQEMEGGKTLYLGWLSGIIKSYNNRKIGYLVEFKNQKDALGRDTSDWTDWVLSVNIPDVQIVTGEENIQTS